MGSACSIFIILILFVFAMCYRILFSVYLFCWLPLRSY